VNCRSPTESGEGERIRSPTADAVGESLEAIVELVGVMPSDGTSREMSQLGVVSESLERATLSPVGAGSSVLGLFWLVGYLWNRGLWRQAP
jgi:hypothetical protein